ncbi:MAG: acyl-CoA reductase [Saprospiraceae bacterium]|nr:acyl-CoA reductase [Saprospiraceae bacterium]
MNLKDRIQALALLGEELTAQADWLEAPIQAAYIENKWFTPENSRKALDAIGRQFLNAKILEEWSNSYEIEDHAYSKKIGLVLAGNIPMVGFHDVLCTFISGHTSLIKCSSKDSILLQRVIARLIEIDSNTSSYFEFVDKLAGFEAVIATGSNNSARYFEQYFGKYPHIIRKNRSAVAVLDGNESHDDFMGLGEDIFTYFGLGCRNVSKIYVPENYDFNDMLEALHEGFKELVHHNKYLNNFDYNNALFLLQKVQFLMSGSLIVTESKDITSRIATLHYEHYSDRSSLVNHLKEVENQIQCVVSNVQLDDIPTFNFGKAQQPSITDYADGVDTLEFLKSL